MTSTRQTDDDGWYPWRNARQRLRKHGEDGEEGEDQHGTHATNIGIHAALLYKQFGQVAAIDADHGDDEIEHEEQHLAGHRGDGIAQLVEIVGCPEEEEPPHTVGKQLAHDESPRLAILEAVQKRELRAVIGLVGSSSIDGLDFSVRLDIDEFGLIDKAALDGRRIDKHPEACPYKADGTDDDEGHLPTEGIGQSGNGERRNEGTDRGTGIEDRGGQGTVFLREILGCDLDGCGEVARLTHGQYHTTGDEQPHTGGVSEEAYLRSLLHGAQGLDAIDIVQPAGGHATAGMQTGTDAPHHDGPDIAFLGAHPVDEATGKERYEGIEEREDGGDGAIVIVVPVELGRDIVGVEQ